MKKNLQGGGHEKGKFSNLDQFVAESFGRKVWVGVDAHKRSYSVAICRDDGVMVSWKTVADNDALVRQISIHGMEIKTQRCPHIRSRGEEIEGKTYPARR